MFKNIRFFQRNLEYWGVSILLLFHANLFVAKSQPSTSNTKTFSWIKVDDFESVDSLNSWILVDTDNNTDPKIENPQVTEVRREDANQNSYLLKKPAEEGIVGNRKALSYRPLPVIAEVGKTYTFHTRLNVEYFPNNHIFGLSNLDPDGINIHNYNAFEPFLRVTDKAESNGTKNDGTLMVCKGGGKGYAKIINPTTNESANPLQTDTWYEIWYVVNNSRKADGGQKYDVYVRGGDEFPQQQMVYKGADFRMQRELPLIYFLTNCNTGPVDKPYGNGGLRYDDIYMVEGELLTSPLE